MQHPWSDRDVGRTLQRMAPTGPSAAALREAAETKGERTRRRLLEVAVRRFGARGFRATSVSEIAREVGVTQAAVYAYYESKDALFEAAVDHDAAAAIASARHKADGTPVDQLLPTLLLTLVAELDEHPLAKRVVSGREPDSLPRLVELPAFDHLCDFLASEVQAGQERGEVRRDLDPVMFANGAETLLLSLVISITQVGSSKVTRRQLGVLSIFEAVLRPPS
jgi:AcrR family transcriptional regulator